MTRRWAAGWRLLLESAAPKPPRTYGCGLTIEVMDGTGKIVATTHFSDEEAERAHVEGRCTFSCGYCYGEACAVYDVDRALLQSS